MKRLLVFLFAVVLLGSCSVTNYQGDFFQGNQKIEFNRANFIYVKTIEGSSYADYNGWGYDKTKAEGLIKEAKYDMYSKHKLGPNQIITNVTKDVLRSHLRSFFGTYKVKVILTADVYEFYEGKPPKVNDITEIKKVNNNRKLEAKDNLETEISKIMQGFLKYNSNQKLNKGTVVVFEAGEKYYKGELRNNASSNGMCKILNVFSYKYESKQWEKSNKSEVTIPANLIIGYKL